MLPSGDLIWVRVQGAAPAATREGAAGAVDVGLGQRISPVAEALCLPAQSELRDELTAAVLIEPSSPARHLGPPSAAEWMTGTPPPATVLRSIRDAR